MRTHATPAQACAVCTRASARVQGSQGERARNSLRSIFYHHAHHPPPSPRTIDKAPRFILGDDPRDTVCFLPGPRARTPGYYIYGTDLTIRLTMRRRRRRGSRSRFGKVKVFAAGRDPSVAEEMKNIGASRKVKLSLARNVQLGERRVFVFLQFEFRDLCRRR